MKQVFTTEACAINQSLKLDEKQAHHLFDVLRTRQRETIRVVNEQQEVYLAHCENKPFLYIFGKEETEPRLVDVTLCTALIKGEKFEWMLQKAAELGVSRIVPFVSRNSVISLDPKKAQRKMERWNAILRSACAQCNRSDLVELMPVSTLSDLKEYKSRCNLVAYEKAEGSSHIANALADNPSSITVVIGPEGGFQPWEIEQLEEEGFRCCSLGSLILRAETAACYVLSVIEYQTHLRPERLDL